MSEAQKAHEGSEQDLSSEPEGAKQLRMRVQRAKPEGLKRPSSPAGLALRGTNGLARLVYIIKTGQNRERSDLEFEHEA